MSTNRRARHSGAASLAIACVALFLGAASRVAPRTATQLRTSSTSSSQRATESCGAVPSLAPTGEWLEMPLDARGGAHAILRADGYVDLARCARAIGARQNDSAASPRPWRRSPRSDVYVDLGRWPLSN